MSEAQLEAALDLTRRLPPANIEDNLFYLLDLVPDLTESLLSSVDQPLKAAPDESVGRDFLLCDYNRDGDSFRSPWSNTYHPPLEDPTLPSDKLREMEEYANRVFDRYRDLYFGTGSISSVYLWDLAGENEDEVLGWAACVLMFKEGDAGSWNSIHVVEVTALPDVAGQPKQFQYKLTSTVMLRLNTEVSGPCDLSGSLTRQETKAFPNPKDETETHVANMGRMIEDLEGRLRTLLDVVYFGKTQEVLSYLREIRGTKEANERAAAQKKVISEMSKAAN